MRRSTLIALAALALLQGALLLRDRAGPSNEERAERARRALPGFEREKVRAIRLERREDPVELALEEEGWRIARPFRARADAGAVEAILSALEFLELRRTVPAGISRRQLGLDPPALRIQLRGVDAELLLGALDPSRQGVYLQAGGQIAVVDASFREAVDRDLDALRDRELVSARPGDLTSLQFRARGEAIELARTRDGRGFLIAAGGVRTRALASRALQIVAAFASLRATRFPREAVAAAPTLSIRARPARGRAVTLELLGPCPARPRDRLVRVSEREPTPVLACVDAADLGPLLSVAPGPEELRDLRLTDLEEPALRAIRIEAGRAALALVRDGARWRLDAGTEADDAALRAWIAALRDTVTRLERLATASARGEELGLGARRILLEREAGGRESIELGAPRDAGLPVRVDGMEGAVLLVAPEARDLFAVDPLRFRSRKVVAVPRHEVAAIVVTRGGAREELARRAEGGFVSASRTVDQERVLALLDRLARLEAVRFATAGEKLIAPVLSLHLRLDPESADRPPRELRLELGPELAGGGCLGRVVAGQRSDLPPFVLAATDCALFRTSLTSAR